MTTGNGNFNYQGSGSTTAGGSSHSSASGTYSDGKVDTMDTSISGKNAAGETGSHDGNWNRNGDTMNYHGSSSTSTGKWSNSAGTVTKTDDGFVAHGATNTSQGAGAGTVVKDGNDVYARSVTTNGETVTRSHTTCYDGQCYGGTVTTNVQQYYAAPYYYYYPQYYAYYACPPGGMSVMVGSYGTSVYSCPVTPVISMTVPLTAMMMAGMSKSKAAKATSAQVTSSPVVMYEVSSEAVVYSTSYNPKGMYWENVKGRSYWVPGAAKASREVKKAIQRAGAMTTPTANATVITYTIGEDLVYLTNEAPLTGIYSQRADVLHAWIPGVTNPTEAERNAIATAVTAHEQGGAKALASKVEELQKSKPAPS
jgi:hypothetical protein